MRSNVAHLLVEDLKLIAEPFGRENVDIDTPFVSRIEAIGQSLDLGFQLRKTSRPLSDLPKIAHVAKPRCSPHPIKFFAMFGKYITVNCNFTEQNARCLANGSARHMMAVHRQIHFSFDAPPASTSSKGSR
jgi:hypothetical protein